MNKRIRIVLFTVLVTAVFVAPLSLLHLLTKPVVDLNEEVFLKRSVLYAAGLELPRSPAQIAVLYGQRIEERSGPGGAYYVLKDGEGKPAGYVFLRTGPGLWGEITAAVGFDGALERLTGVDFLKQSETPGLGARISETWFREQFRGKRGPFTVVGEGQSSREDEFDAVTGATLTTNLVRDLLNGTVAQVRDLVR